MAVDGIVVDADWKSIPIEWTNVATKINVISANTFQVADLNNNVLAVNQTSTENNNNLNFNLFHFEIGGVFFPIDIPFKGKKNFRMTIYGFSYSTNNGLIIQPYFYHPDGSDTVITNTAAIDGGSTGIKRNLNLQTNANLNGLLLQHENIFFSVHKGGNIVKRDGYFTKRGAGANVFTLTGRGSGDVFLYSKILNCVENNGLARLNVNVSASNSFFNGTVIEIFSQ